MDKVFLLNVTKGNFNGSTTHTSVFGDKENAYRVLKVIRDKYVAEREEAIADEEVMIGNDIYDCFEATDADGEDFFKIDVIERVLVDNVTDEALFNGVADKIGYWVNGVYHI